MSATGAGGPVRVRNEVSIESPYKIKITYYNERIKRMYLTDRKP